ncbi:MAG: flagellar filament capping protein FliD, partial [Nitrospinota bacterium]
MTQSSIEKKILRINQALDKESDPTLLKESGSKTDGKADLVRDEQKRLEQKNFQIERKIASLKGELNVGKNVPVAEEENPGKSKPDSFPKPDSGIKEEFATLRELSNLVQDSFIFMQRSVPGAVLQDGVGSALRTQESLKSLQGQTPGTFLHSRFTFHSAFTALRTRDLQEFGTRLSKLDNAASRLGNKESLDIKPATTTEPEKISFSTSFDSPEGTFSVKVLETARGGTIASNQVEDPFSSLNLTGSFSINGYSVSVSASDSLNDIANQINFGEDNNKNGKLDFSEDVNGNGSLDKTFVSGGTTPAGYIGSFSYFEDIDADNRLDPSEDLNNNLILDGGSSQIKVSATIERDRLFLTSLSANNISLSDDTGVLKELGFFTENPSGMVIKNDRQLLQNGTNLNSERKHASLEINDIPYSKDSNEISDIIPSTVISIKKKSSLATVRIQKDFSKLINAIKEFRADYNEVIEFMNDQELSSKILDRDPHLQNARSSLIQDVVAAKPDRNLNQLSAKEAGFQHANQKRRVHQASLANLAEMVKKKSTVSLSIPFGGQNSLLGALEKGGVSRRENDFLNVDEKSVNRALQNNLNATVSLLAGNEGISRKIKTITDSFLDRMTGTLQIQ